MACQNSLNQQTVAFYPSSFDGQSLSFPDKPVCEVQMLFLGAVRFTL